MMKVNWHERSTIRGAVWLVVGIVGLVLIFFDKDVNQIISLGAAIAGGIGVAFPDKPEC